MRCEDLASDGGHPSVTFSEPDEDLQPPDPQLLALHAACARAAHMSGAVETLYLSESNVEDAEVMSSDG